MISDCKIDPRMKLPYLSPGFRHFVRRAWGGLCLEKGGLYWKLSLTDQEYRRKRGYWHLGRSMPAAGGDGDESLREHWQGWGLLLDVFVLYHRWKQRGLLSWLPEVMMSGSRVPSGP